MIDYIDNILAELKTFQSKLPELRDLFWLKIDRYDEADQQRGVEFDEKFEQQRNKLCRMMNVFSTFIEKSFAPSAKEVAKEKALLNLHKDFPNFDDWNDEAKRALLDREVQTILIKATPKAQDKVPEEPNHNLKYQENAQSDKVYSLDSNFSHCRPCFIELRDKKHAVNNWAMVLKELAQILYADNSTPIMDFISKDLSKKPLFSTEPKIYLRPLEITNGLFVEANLSANMLCNSCKKLLDIYSIAHSEFKIYLDRIPAKI